VLEEREVQPIGAARPIKVDFRVIAATNSSVEDQVDKGEFRSDLYYRLNVARVEIPDLCERPQDISLYLNHLSRRSTVATVQTSRRRAPN
jgi:transcriptional regulator with PAS, ATPase and Fis domain